MLRTHTCGELTKEHIDNEVTLSGWVNRRRDHGDLIFIDLRDRYGITQVKFDPSVNKDSHAQAESLRSEWVVKVTGKVIARPDGMTNDKMDTGEIELLVSDIEILNKSKTPPFEIAEDTCTNEEVRLKYRFLDLRHQRLQDIMRYRDAVMTEIRDYCHKHDFTEVQTPIMANSSPEGARDFLVPSRLHPGQFYALPQAPQQFKQLLMVGGLDKYFQIAPCFRDEDPRADRAPCEFYQLDIEMSFVEQEDVFNYVEGMMIDLTKKFTDKELLTPEFPRITYEEAMNKYGSDKPDLRFENYLQDASEIVKGSEFSIFNQALDNGGVVKVMNVKGGGVFTRKIIDELTKTAQDHGAGGLAYIIKDAEGIRSPIVKFISEEIQQKLYEETNFEEGDILFFAADKMEKACSVLGAIRNHTAEILELKDNSKIAWCWVIDFPMYEYDEDLKKVEFSHNPFSMPQGGLEALENEDPLNIKAYQYDLACNGLEISSGAIRNHNPEIMYKAFDIAGYSKEDVQKEFGHMLSAFEYGAPPHGGIAPGIDRLLMIFKDLENIRDVYAFPKNGKAQDPMLESPSEVAPEQLEELSISIDKDDDIIS